MISAREARNIVNIVNPFSDLVEKYLTTLDTQIKDAAQSGATTLYKGWRESVHPGVVAEIEKVLRENGYNIEIMPPSHYHEWGGIIINW